MCISQYNKHATHVSIFHQIIKRPREVRVSRSRIQRFSLILCDLHCTLVPTHNLVSNLPIFWCVSLHFQQCTYRVYGFTHFCGTKRERVVDGHACIQIGIVHTCSCGWERMHLYWCRSFLIGVLLLCVCTTAKVVEHCIDLSSME